MNICWANGSESLKLKLKEGLKNHRSCLLESSLSLPALYLPKRAVEMILMISIDDIDQNIQKIKGAEAFIELWKDRIGKRLKVIPP